MRKIKRILTLCLVVATVFASSLAVSAAPAPSNTSGSKVSVTNKGTRGSYSGKYIRVKVAGKNAVSYRIRYRTPGGKWKTVAVKKNEKEAKIKKLKDKGLYEIQVQAKAKGSKWTTAKTTSHCYMNTAQKVRAKAKKSAAKVSWKKQKSASGWQICYSTKKNMSNAKSVKAKKGSTAKTIKGLKRRKTYYVKVRPYIVKNGKTYYGIYSRAVKIKVK